MCLIEYDDVHDKEDKNELIVVYIDAAVVAVVSILLIFEARYNGLIIGLLASISNVNTCNYSDNGLGFDINNKKNGKGLGMKNIEGRINFIGGSMKISSEINKGTQVVFNF